MEPSIRQMSYAAVKPMRLATVLAKLGKGAAASGGSASTIMKVERRRKEADEVARLVNR